MTRTTAPGEQLQRLAERVRRQDPLLDTLMMHADGKYQTRSAPLDVLTRDVRECLAAGFAQRRPQDFPMHYFAWGKCRVGSTPLTNLFGLTGMPSYYQPVKMILRHVFIDGATAPWIVPFAADAPDIFSKETAGPYCLAESLFNPLQLLVEAGYPANRLHVILLDREPASSLASWLDKMSGCVPDSMLLQNYVVAALNAVGIESYARRSGIPVSHYVYEASKDAVRSVGLLFDRLGLAARFTASAVTDWHETGQLRSKQSLITFNDEPEIYDVKNLHGSDTAYRYRARPTMSVTEPQLEMLERCGVNAGYRASVDACVRDLGFDATTADRLFGRTTEAAA
jgi:hypothetical protein